MIRPASKAAVSIRPRAEECGRSFDNQAWVGELEQPIGRQTSYRHADLVRWRVEVELGVFAEAARYVPRIGIIDRKEPPC